MAFRKVWIFLFGLLAFSSSSPGAEVAILFRRLASAETVLQFVLDGDGRGWPEVLEFVKRTGRRPFSQLTRAETMELSNAVYANPRSWGHVALEFPPGYQPRSLGWLPRATPEQMQEMAAFVRSPQGKPKPKIDGSFVDAEEWKNDDSIPVPLQRILVADLTDSQIAELRARAESMTAGEWKYQLATSYTKTLDENCANCATAVKEVFRAIQYDLKFIPDNGSMTAMVGEIQMSVGKKRGYLTCNFLFEHLTSAIKPAE